MIRPAFGQWKMSMKEVNATKVRKLAELNSPVVLRGFKGTGDRNLLIEKSYEFGTPTPWKFGLVLEVKDRGVETRGLNNVLSAEWMPFHYDGLFKTATRKKDDGTEALFSVPPRLMPWQLTLSSLKANFSGADFRCSQQSHSRLKTQATPFLLPQH